MLLVKRSENNFVMKESICSRDGKNVSIKSLFGLLLICALFAIMYKFMPFQQNNVFVQPNNTYWSNLNTTSKWCKGHLRFLDPPGPLTALASSPGAGNTWVRYLIQQFTGYVTGGLYLDKALRKSGFPGEKIFDGRVIVIKTHETT